ncbi:hypothetical protein DMENIID0001_045310 [Sergentomyia squamirostris]
MEVFITLIVLLAIVIIVVLFLYKRKKLARNRETSAPPPAIDVAEQRRRYGLVKPEEQVQSGRRSTATTPDTEAPEVFVISEQRRQNTPADTNFHLERRRPTNPQRQRLTDEQIIGLDPPPSYEIALTEREREQETHQR